MLIFKRGDLLYVYIHIPKNSGKYIRKKIASDERNTVVKSYWDISNGIDMEHIPYISRNMVLDSSKEYRFIAHSRNPYDRLISAYFYLNPNKSTDDFRHFCLHILPLFEFNTEKYDRTYIHYYPQYLFLCDEDEQIGENIWVSKVEDCCNSKRYELQEYYTKEIVLIVNRIYEKDFYFFGYNLIQE